MNIKCIIISILGLTQGGLAEDPEDMSPKCEMVADLCNSVSRDKLLKGYVATKASGSNPCMVELLTKLKSLDLVGVITNPDKCEEAIRGSFAEKRRMSIMDGEGAVDRDLGWFSIGR